MAPPPPLALSCVYCHAFDHLPCIIYLPTCLPTCLPIPPSLPPQAGIDLGPAHGDLHETSGRMTYRGRVMHRTALISQQADTGQVGTVAAVCVVGRGKGYPMRRSHGEGTNCLSGGRSCSGGMVGRGHMGTGREREGQQ